MFKILFICTDNVGRSLTAKYLLEDWLRKNGRDDIAVSSAGIRAGSDISSFSMDHMARLLELGVDASRYERTQVTRELIMEHDLAIVMDEEQKHWIGTEFGIELPLYNEILRGESTPVLITLPGMTETIGERLLRMVEYIYDYIPQLVEKIDKLVDGQRENNRVE
jgi:predicted protein tyrosine phosphatase